MDTGPSDKFYCIVLVLAVFTYELRDGTEMFGKHKQKRDWS